MLFLLQHNGSPRLRDVWELPRRRGTGKLGLESIRLGLLPACMGDGTGYKTWGYCDVLESDRYIGG
jgi:hypothetical protein